MGTRPVAPPAPIAWLVAVLGAVLWLAAPALAADPQVAPSASPAAVEGITSDGATLTATVTPGDADTRVSFEYGTTAEYGIGTAVQAVPAGTEPVAVRQEIAGLGPQRTFHVRVVARSASGVAYGEDRVFSTSSIPVAPFVLTLTPDAISSTGATLQGRVATGDGTASASFEYGPTPALGSATPPAALGAGAWSSPLSTPITGLQPNTRYYARAVATNASGTSAGPVVAFETSPAITKLTAELSRSRVDFGDSTTVSGELTGAGVGGATVTLLRQDFPFSAGPESVATTTARADGTYAFEAGPLPGSAKFWVRAEGAPSMRSNVLAVYGKLKVTLKTSRITATGGTVSGMVAPFVEGAKATLQRRAGSGRWVTVSRPKLTRDGASDRATWTARGTRYRSATMKYRLRVTPAVADGQRFTSTSNVVGLKRR